MKIENAILQVLRQSREPLHILRITEEIQKQNIVSFNAKNPPSSVGPFLYRHIKHNRNSPFIQTDSATFGLRSKVKKYADIAKQESLSAAELEARTAWHENKATAIYYCNDWKWLVVKKVHGRTMWRGYRKATPEIVRYFERYGYSLEAARAEKHFIIEL